MKALFAIPVKKLNEIIGGSADVSIYGDEEKTEIEGDEIVVMHCIGALADAGLIGLVSVSP